MPRLRVPMSSPDLTDAERAAVSGVLSTSALSNGASLDRFEGRLAVHAGTRHAIAVSSGTAALHLCVIAAGVSDGDFVVTTPFSFVASANCVLYERACPIFVDVDPATGNIDPDLVREAVDDLARDRNVKRWLPRSLQDERFSARRLRALLPVHTFGEPADMDPLIFAARAHDLVVIEDACEAIGATYRGRPAGNLGDLGVFAFYPNKQITTGEGGAIMTNRTEWNDLCRSLRNQGRDVFDGWLNHSRLGYNYRLDELSAALGLVQLERIGELLIGRERVAQWYHERLATVDRLDRPSSASTATRRSWFVYVVRLTPDVDRSSVMAALEDCGIPSRPYFTPIHRQPFYVDRFGYRRGDFPVAEALAERCLALPFSSVMTESQVDEVCERLVSVLARQPLAGGSHVR